MRKLLRRLQYLIRRRDLEPSVAEEIESHIALRQQDLERSGMSPEAAAYITRRTLGKRAAPLSDVAPGTLDGVALLLSAIGSTA